jgi:hypothetical protein
VALPQRPLLAQHFSRTLLAILSTRIPSLLASLDTILACLIARLFLARLFVCLSLCI